jgi:hypothetical protein
MGVPRSIVRNQRKTIVFSPVRRLVRSSGGERELPLNVRFLEDSQGNNTSPYYRSFKLSDKRLTISG